MKIKNINPTKKQLHITVLIISAVLITAVSIMLALLGTRVYRNSVADKSEQALYDASAYFTHEIRGCESSSQIRVASLGGKLPALVIASGEEGGRETWLFTYDGNLCRTSAKPGESVSAETGQAVMPLEAVDFHMLRSDLIEITIISRTGDSTTLNLHLADNGGDDNE